MPNFRGSIDSDFFDEKKFLYDIRNRGTIKKFICFFNSENFLMTNYCPLSENIHALFEFENGDTLQFDTMLCGYVGHGPTNTVEALITLGIPKEDAENYCYRQRGLQLELERTGADQYRVVSEAYPVWFDSFREDDRSIVCTKKISYSLKKRVVVVQRPMDEPTGGLSNLLRLIRYASPFLYEYSVDPKAPLVSARELAILGLQTCGNNELGQENHANVLVEGNRFNVYVCIPYELIFSTLNVLHYAWEQEPLFYTCSYHGIPVLTDHPIERPTLFTALRGCWQGNLIQPRKRILLKKKAGMEDNNHAVSQGKAAG